MAATNTSLKQAGTQARVRIGGPGMSSRVCAKPELFATLAMVELTEKCRGRA